jgi:serine/threonine protein phosphatase PrpC
MALTEPGWLLVCSDGLWNYCSAAADLRDLVRERAATDPEPTAVAAALVDIANGMSRQVAEADSQAHSITKWLGVDSPDPTPRCSVETIDGAGGWLLVCSDGLWNYCSDAVALRALIDTTAGRVGDDPLAVAGGLVDWANEQGGVDNIAAVLARVPAPDPAEPIS